MIVRLPFQFLQLSVLLAGITHALVPLAFQRIELSSTSTLFLPFLLFLALVGPIALDVLLNLPQWWFLSFLFGSFLPFLLGGLPLVLPFLLVGVKTCSNH
jgi:hypothetical protein